MCLVLRRAMRKTWHSSYFFKIYFVSVMRDIIYGGGFKPDLDRDAENNKCHRKREIMKEVVLANGKEIT